MLIAWHLSVNFFAGPAACSDKRNARRRSWSVAVTNACGCANKVGCTALFMAPRGPLFWPPSVKINWKFLWATAKETVNEFLQDRAMRLAAATAYYAIFSIGPLLVLTIGVAGVVFGQETVRKEVVEQI